MATNNTSTLRAVILTALPIEYQAVRGYLSDLQEEIHPEGTIYERGTFMARNKRWEVGLVETRMGIARASFEAGRAIDYFKPKLVLFIGVAGGLKDVKLGDVVAATKVYGYEYGKADGSFKPRPEIGLSTYRMIQRAQAEARSQQWLQRLNPLPQPPPRAYVQPIAAGDKVISSTRSATWKLLARNYSDALAVEMEGYGFLQAVHGNQHVDALIIRGISDLIDGKREADALGSQERAALHASAFAFEVLAKLSQDDFGRGVPGDKGPKNGEPPDGPKYNIHQRTSRGTIIAPIGEHVQFYSPASEKGTDSQ